MMISMLKKNRHSILLLLLLLLCCSFAFAQHLELEKVTVVSRHSVRAPLDTYLTTLNEMTGGGYHWTKWSVPGSYMTLRGGALETMFGEYFRLWLDDEDFKLDSVQQIYFGASSKQRTIATARAFAAGVFPLMTVPVDYKLKENNEIGVHQTANSTQLLSKRKHIVSLARFRLLRILFLRGC